MIAQLFLELQLSNQSETAGIKMSEHINCVLTEMQKIYFTTNSLYQIAKILWPCFAQKNIQD